MANVLRCEIAHTAVKRVVANTSQTKLNRERRWDNVAGIFQLKKPEQFAGKHVLLLDDTLTTGATLESCGHTILEAADVKLSIATLAIAR
jgi:predicted amidophosphoribosyltransferase